MVMRVRPTAKQRWVSLCGQECTRYSDIPGLGSACHMPARFTAVAVRHTWLSRRVGLRRATEAARGCALFAVGATHQFLQQDSREETRSTVYFFSRRALLWFTMCSVLLVDVHML